MGYVWFKAALFTLLAWNAAVFLWSGTGSEALDASAWLVLLVLFELETGYGKRWIGSRAEWLARACRLAAGAALVAALVGYVGEGEWLDSVNMGLWVAVVILLEIQVRNPGFAARRRAALSLTPAVLYSGLAALVLAWAWQRAWFDAYDALLWLIAFATIEMNIFQTARRDAARAHAG